MTISSRIRIIPIIILMYGAIPSTRCVSREESRASPPFPLEQIISYEGITDWAFGDFDGDGTEEYAKTDGKGVQVSDFIESSLRTAGDLVGRSTVLRLRALDIDDDSFPEILIGIQKNDSVWTEVWTYSSLTGENNYSRLLKTEPVSVADLNNDGRWDGIIAGYQVIDANDDEDKDILITFSTGYDMYPRGLMAFDGRTGDRIWDYPMAGHPYTAECADLNGDGKMEIIIGDRAPCNGNRAGDMDDCHSYIICLNRHGELVWKHETGGVFTRSAFAISGMNGDRTLKVICTYSSGNQADVSTHFELQVRNGITGEVENSFSLPTEFIVPFMNDFNADGDNEIVIGNEDGWIYLFDQNLEVLKKGQIAGGLQKWGISEVADINDDGKEEITVTSQNKLYVLNSDLEIIGTHSFEAGKYAGNAHYFNNPYYGNLLSVLVGGKNESKTGVIVQMLPRTSAETGTPRDSQSRPVFYLLLIAAGIVVTVTGWKVIPMMIRKLRFTASLRPEDLRDRLLETLSVFGHGKAATANLNRLSFLFKNLDEDQYASPQYRKKLSDTIDTYYDFTAPKLAEIADRARLVDVEREHLKKLQKSLGEIETLVDSYSEGHTSFGQVVHLKEEIPEQVEAVEDIIKIMTNDLARFYSCNIGYVTSRVLAALLSILKRDGIQIDVQLYGETETGSGFVDKSDFTTILEELVNNAIFSMKESLEKHLTVKLTVEDSRIIVEVSDTGCGIRKEDHKRIFEREFSTKEHGGFGLYHAKATLSKYGGKIKVVRSEPGRGTTMRVEIKRI